MLDGTFMLLINSWIDLRSLCFKILFGSQHFSSDAWRFQEIVHRVNYGKSDALKVL